MAEIKFNVSKEEGDNEQTGGKNQKKSVLALILIAVVCVVVCFLVFKGGPEHIEDTNGADNYTLQTITDKDIVELKMGSRGFSEHYDSISNTTSYESKKFTGVYEVFREGIITNRFEITVNHAQVNSGNFKMVLVVNGEIVHEFKLNELMQTYEIKDISGDVSLIVAGESADFMFDYWIQ